jgi:hypothetical protein
MPQLIKTQDVEGYPAYAYVINHTEIINPFESECSRFTVDPSYYGLTIDQANELVKLNKQLKV